MHVSRTTAAHRVPGGCCCTTADCSIQHKRCASSGVPQHDAAYSNLRLQKHGKDVKVKGVCGARSVAIPLPYIEGNTSPSSVLAFRIIATSHATLAEAAATCFRQATAMFSQWFSLLESRPALYNFRLALNDRLVVAFRRPSRQRAELAHLHHEHLDVAVVSSPDHFSVAKCILCS